MGCARQALRRRRLPGQLLPTAKGGDGVQGGRRSRGAPGRHCEAPTSRIISSALTRGFPRPDDSAAAAPLALANLSTVLTNAGASLADVVKATVFVTNIAQQDIFAKLRAEHFPDKPHLAESFAEVSSLAGPEWMIEIEAIGLVR
ncbi:RidA family protein [Streptomyces inhibens]|uniref:RidA family protein n=1 Tax=Streptomyces inhibens TaxID=2293571 RepID=UPI0036B38DEB